MGMGTTSSKPRASQFISRTPFPAVPFPLCYHPALPLGPKHLEKSAAHEHTLGRRKGAGYTLAVPLALAELHRSLLHSQSVLCPGPWFYCPCTGSAPAQAQLTAPSALFQAGTGTVGPNFVLIPAPLPTGSIPSSAFLKGTSIARDDKGAILVDLVSAS